MLNRKKEEVGEAGDGGDNDASDEIDEDDDGDENDNRFKDRSKPALTNTSVLTGPNPWNKARLPLRLAAIARFIVGCRCRHTSSPG